MFPSPFLKTNLNMILCQSGSLLIRLLPVNYIAVEEYVRFLKVLMSKYRKCLWMKLLQVRLKPAV